MGGHRVAPVTEHRCHRGERCAEAEKVETTVCGADCPCHLGPWGRCVEGGCGSTHRTGTVRVGGPIHAAQGLCLTCTRVVTDAITELPRDYVELHLALERGSAGLQELVAATKDLPAALRVNIAALAAEMVRVTLAWAELVAERLNIEWDSTSMGRHTRPGPALQRVSSLLARSVPVLLALRDVEVETWAENGWYRSFDPTDGVDGALWMLRLHQITRAALGQTKLVHELPAPCPNCNRMGLTRENGDDNVRCVNCRVMWPETDYTRLTLVTAQDYKDASPVRPPRWSRPRSTADGTIGRPVPAG